MSPADVYVGWLPPGAGGALLSHRRNGAGYDPPAVLPGAAGALLLSAGRSAAAGRTNVTFTRPLRTGVATEAQFTPGALLYRRVRACTWELRRLTRARARGTP
jgi:hypothetical protein